jgi:hypothetical protein
VVDGLYDRIMADGTLAPAVAKLDRQYFKTTIVDLQLPAELLERVCIAVATAAVTSPR